MSEEEQAFEVAFAKLAASSTADEDRLYQAVPVRQTGQCFLAKLADGCPCLLVGTSAFEQILPASVQLEHLTVQHGLMGKLHGRDVPASLKFSCVRLTTNEPALVSVFLRFARFLAYELQELPSSAEVAASVRQLVDMLQLLRQPGRKTIQGLWAELLLIASANEPKRWCEAWHSDPMEMHDFCFPDGRVEVKSSSANYRSHRFSHRQLWPPAGKHFAVASVFVNAATNGMSVFDLAKEVRTSVAIETSIRMDQIILSSLGCDYSRSDMLRFDRDAAIRSLRFFPISAVPRIAEELPERVFDLSYTVILDDSDGFESVSWA